MNNLKETMRQGARFQSAQHFLTPCAFGYYWCAIKVIAAFDTWIIHLYVLEIPTREIKRKKVTQVLFVHSTLFSLLTRIRYRLLNQDKWVTR